MADRRRTARAFAVLILALAAGIAFGYFVELHNQGLASGQPAEQAEQACLEAVTAELELLAANALEGHDIVIKDGYVTIIQVGGEVLTTGELLQGTESCHYLVGDQ